MPETWGGRSSFQYDGSVDDGTDIRYGKNSAITVTARHYAELRQEFLGLAIPAGTSRTNPPPGSLGDWLQNHVTPTAIASYVAAILVLEGHAERVGRSRLKIIR